MAVALAVLDVEREEAAGLRAAVDEVMPVRDILGESGAIARPQDGLAAVLDQHRFADEHDDEFVDALMPVTLAGPGAGLQRDVAHPDVGQPRGWPQPPIPAAGDVPVIRARVTRAIGLLDAVEIDLGHGASPIVVC